MGTAEACSSPGAASPPPPLPASPPPPLQQPPPASLPRHWAQRHMQLAFARRDGFACSLIAQATLPLPASLLFEVLVHPENAAILRSLDRCTHRLVLEGDGCGRLACEVEHETSCHFLWFSGTVRTPLSVEQDASELTMRYSLRGRCGHLLQLQGCWRITDGDGPSRSVLHAEQSFTPRGLPPLLGGAVRSWAAAQVRGSFEDLHAEALRIRGGRPTLGYPPALLQALPPADSSASASGDEQPAQKGGAPGTPSSADRASVLHGLSAPSSRTSSDESGGSSCPSSPFALSTAGPRPPAVAVAASSVAAPSSHPLPLLRLLSAASSCLEEAFGAAAVCALAAKREPVPASSKGQRRESGRGDGSARRWLAMLLAAAAWLLAAAATALPRLLGWLARSELSRTEALAARLAGRLGEAAERS